MSRKEIDAFTVEDIERMIKDLGRAEYKLELLTEDRDKYKRLWEESCGDVGTGASGRKEAAAVGGAAATKDTGGSGDKELRERVRLLEEYILQLDWPEVEYPKALGELFQRNQGKLRTEDYEYSGEMIRGSPNGKGRKVFTNGDVSEGVQVDGWSHGITKFTSTADGYTQECLCRHGTPEGYFVRQYANGDKETGCFHEGDWHGVIQQEQKSGETYFRCYSKGKENGKVLHLWPEKKVVRVCEFAEGAPVTPVSIYKYSHTE